MFDPERLLGQMLGGALGGALGGSRGAGGLGRMLGRSGVSRGAAGLGLLGIAMAAWEHHQQTSASRAGASVPPPAPPGMPPPPPPAAGGTPPAQPGIAPTMAAPILSERQQEAALLVRAMVAAAAADGRIDEDERQRIGERARTAGDDADTLAWLDAELRRPVALEQLVAQTPAAQAEAVWLAARLAITCDTDRERDWLQRLAAALGVTPERRTALEAALGAD